MEEAFHSQKPEELQGDLGRKSNEREAPDPFHFLSFLGVCVCLCEEALIFVYMV